MLILAKHPLVFGNSLTITFTQDFKSPVSSKNSYISSWHFKWIMWGGFWTGLEVVVLVLVDMLKRCYTWQEWSTLCIEEDSVENLSEILAKIPYELALQWIRSDKTRSTTQVQSCANCRVEHTDPKKTDLKTQDNLLRHTGVFWLFVAIRFGWVFVKSC